MRILISGGGTGGHVNPALAIAKIIERGDRDAVIAYVGTPRGIENKLVPDKYHMYHVEVRGLSRSLSPKNIKALYLAAASGRAAKKIIAEFRPDLVIGTGGYVCWPICRAAAKAGIPTVLHESNFQPGFAIKTLEKKADIIFVNYEETEKMLADAKKVVHIGTPLREDFSRITKESARRTLGIPNGERLVLSFGGSLGAAKINSEMMSVMRNFGKYHPEVRFLHGTGRADFAACKASFDAAGLNLYPNLTVAEYIYDMPLQMAAADLVICRSGALTLSEIAKLGCASILIPSPNVTADQQTKNARLFDKSGAAYMITEDNLSGGFLVGEVESLIFDDDRLSKMRAAVKKFDIENTDKIFWNEICGLIKKP